MIGLNGKLTSCKVLSVTSDSKISIWNPATGERISTVKAKVPIDKFNPQGGCEIQIQEENLFIYLTSPTKNKYEIIQLL